MKRKFLFVMTFAVFAFGFSTAQAQRVIPKVNPKSVKMIKPDLRVSDVQITKTSDNFIDKITITVTNGCQATAADSYVLVTFKASADTNAPTLLYVGNTVLALRGGASYTQTFDIKNTKNIPSGSFIHVEADPYKKVSEGDENNNWRSLNPNSSPFPSMGVCDPK